MKALPTIAVCLSCFLFALSLGTPQPSEAHVDDVYWADGFCIPGADDNVGIQSFALYDGKLYAGGRFTAIGCAQADNVAAFDGSSWAPVGAGTNGTVWALTVYDNKLIAGGAFTAAGGGAAYYIAAWDGATWSPLSSETDGLISALAVYDNKLIAGGVFTTAGGGAANNIAAWDGAGWAPLGTGINQVSGYPVRDMCVFDGKLIVGGEFYHLSTNVVAWNGSSWSALGAGLGNEICPVWALTVHGGDLFAAQNYYASSPGCSPDAVHSWDGSTWSPVGTGMGGSVFDLFVYNGDLVASNYKSVKAWDGMNWTELGSGLASRGYPLAEYNNNLTDGKSSWDGMSWSPLGPGIDGSVKALIVHNDKLYIGGEFDHAGVVAASRIASWDGDTWLPLGPGLDVVPFGTSIVDAFAVYGGELIAGGTFRSIGGVDMWGIASWNGAGWSSLGPGCGTVDALEVYDGKLMVGGDLSEYLLGFPVDGIAAWNGSSWASFGDDCFAKDFTIYGGNLVACGFFPIVGETARARVAYWNGASWVPVGSGLRTDQSTFDVLDVTEYNGKLIAGCEFGVWYYDGCGWLMMGTGVWNKDVNALLVHTGKLYAGGSFSMVEGWPMNFITRWDENSDDWISLGSGTDMWVNALATFENTLMVGGDFTKAGGKPSGHLARWTYGTPTAVAIAGFHAAASEGGIVLSWSLKSDETIEGIKIYRRRGSIGAETLLNDQLIPASETTYLDKTALPGERYVYTLAAVGARSGEVRSLPAEAELPLLALELYQNSPNPFNPTTTIRYAVPRASRVTLRVYTSAGQLVRTLVDGKSSPGAKEVTWDGTNDDGGPVASGVYVYRLQTGKETRSKKMVLLK